MLFLFTSIIPDQGRRALEPKPEGQDGSPVCLYWEETKAPTQWDVCANVLPMIENELLKYF